MAQRVEIEVTEPQPRHAGPTRHSLWYEVYAREARAVSYGTFADGSANYLDCSCPSPAQLDKDFCAFVSRVGVEHLSDNVVKREAQRLYRRSDARLALDPSVAVSVLIAIALFFVLISLL